MARAKNKVVAGDYLGSEVSAWWPSGKSVSVGGCPIDKEYVEMYEVLTEEKMKSGASAVFRGAIGAAVLGPVGLLAGLSARNKGIYSVAILWKDGKRSLLEVDDRFYKLIVRSLF